MIHFGIPTHERYEWTTYEQPTENGERLLYIFSVAYRRILFRKNGSRCTGKTPTHPNTRTHLQVLEVCARNGQHTCIRNRVAPTQKPALIRRCVVLSCSLGFFAENQKRCNNTVVCTTTALRQSLTHGEKFRKSRVTCRVRALLGN